MKTKMEMVSEEKKKTVGDIDLIRGTASKLGKKKGRLTKGAGGRGFFWFLFLVNSGGRECVFLVLVGGGGGLGGVGGGGGEGEKISWKGDWSGVIVEKIEGKLKLQSSTTLGKRI